MTNAKGKWYRMAHPVAVENELYGRPQPAKRSRPWRTERRLLHASMTATPARRSRA
jgi:hypothetical protein